MSVTGAMVVRQALSHRGETEHPPHSNQGEFVELCQRATFLSGTGWPWCAAFICLIAKQVGRPLSYPSASAHGLGSHYGLITDHHRWEPGMVVDFNIGTGHTGVLVSVEGEFVKTVDGNWSDSVEEHLSPLSQVRGVWAIPGVIYAQTHATSPPPKLPPFVVATSAHGHRKIVFRAQKKAGLVAWLTGNNLARLFPNGITIKRAKTAR